MKLEIELAVPVRERLSTFRVPLDVEEEVFYTGTHMDDRNIMRNIRRCSDTTEVLQHPAQRTTSAISVSEYQKGGIRRLEVLKFGQEMHKLRRSMLTLWFVIPRRTSPKVAWAVYVSDGA
jgi:hypothetical protein